MPCRRADRNSYVCYILFCIAFLSDCSLLTLAMPLSAFAYALVSIKPSGTYWQVGGRKQGARGHRLYGRSNQGDRGRALLVALIAWVTRRCVSVVVTCARVQMILVYCEAIIVTQYAFMVPEQLRCDFISPIVQHK